MAFALVYFAVDKLAGEEIIAVSARLVDNLPGRVIYLTRGKGVILRQISIMEKIYAKCVELGASTMLTAGPGAHVPGAFWPNAAPDTIYEVAKDFPELTIIAERGCYPFITELIAVALTQDNVYFDIGAYELFPGSASLYRGRQHHPYE